MLYTDEKIDYTNYLRDKPQETDPVKIGAMKARLDQAVLDAGIKGPVTCTYYTDGNVMVYIDGESYRMFNTRSGTFFSGYPGSGFRS